MNTNVSYGPLMIDVEGLTLNDADKRRLRHPLVGGVILFSRNYKDPVQLSALTQEIAQLRNPPLPITVDHEGGRVQRFREGFTRLPAMRLLGELHAKDPIAADESAEAVGLVLATELRAHGVDFSFTPVLDLDWGRSGVIGDRSFSKDPQIVSRLAAALIRGLAKGGMGSCGKHFPGHGWVEADSHVAIPVDERSMAEIETDMQPYHELSLDAVMPAHVIYPVLDERPAGFSPRWLEKLRLECQFDGIIFSDDLSMEGASVAGSIVERANAAWDAGCDVLLVCNKPDFVDELLAEWMPEMHPVRAARIPNLLGQAGLGADAPLTRAQLEANAEYQAALKRIQAL
jgi:beta-N-acetylhexosaminidase